MNPQQWKNVDAYFNSLLIPTDPSLELALADSQAAGLPAINVAPSQGKLLHVLAQLIGARSILEIGTLGGYSTIWLARALQPGGKLITLEYDPKHAKVATANLQRAGVADRVEIRIGAALESLPKIAAERASAPFDLVFVDADKPNTAAYFDWSVRLCRPGGLIIVDNVVRKGDVLNADSDDPAVQGMRTFLDRLGQEKRVNAAALQTVTSKSYDGFAIALRLPD